MEPGSILIVGVGGIGCKWSSRAHGRCQQLSELLLIDADESSFSSEYEAHCLHLDASGSGKGTAALPNLAAHRLNEGVANIQGLLKNSELVIILAALGGGTGSGAAAEIAARSAEAGSLVISIVGMPFAEQPLRSAIADKTIPADAFHVIVSAQSTGQRWAPAQPRRLACVGCDGPIGATAVARASIRVGVETLRVVAAHDAVANALDPAPAFRR